MTDVFCNSCNSVKHLENTKLFSKHFEKVVNKISGIHPGQVAHTQGQFRIFNPPNVHALRLWEETQT